MTAHDQHATSERGLHDQHKKSHKKTDSMCIMPTRIFLTEEEANIPPPPHLTDNDIVNLFRDAAMQAEANREHSSSDSESESESDSFVLLDHPPRFIHNRFLYDISDESESEEEEEVQMLTPDMERRVTRNGTVNLLNKIKSMLRFMRVDVHTMENNGVTAHTAAMRTRIEDIEMMIDRFEDSNIIRRRLFQNNTYNVEGEE